MYGKRSSMDETLAIPSAGPTWILSPDLRVVFLVFGAGLPLQCTRGSPMLRRLILSIDRSLQLGNPEKLSYTSRPGLAIESFANR